MRTIAISDIHGCYSELKCLIDKLSLTGQYRPGTDRLIFLGDYIDRGPDSRLVIQYIRNLQAEYGNVIALMGNHEDMLLKYLDQEDDNWFYNGYESTLLSYVGHEDDFKADTYWMRKLPLYFTDDHFVYVHAGVDASEPMESQEKATLLWTRSGWEKYEKPIIFGHTTCFAMGLEVKYYEINGNFGIDTGCAYGGALTALIIDDDKVSGYCQVDSDMCKYSKAV